MASLFSTLADLPPPTGLEGRSNNSSSTDVTQLGLLDDQRTHHLLKHCLSDGQRVDALAQFGAQDVKDAAKEISRMGQRELQSKFKVSAGALRRWRGAGPAAAAAAALRARALTTTHPFDALPPRAARLRRGHA
jgi:hypothetical protein